MEFQNKRGKYTIKLMYMGFSKSFDGSGQPGCAFWTHTIHNMYIIHSTYIIKLLKATFLLATSRLISHKL